MEPHVQAFWLAKLGNAADEYEDAFAYSLTSRRFAIADGATESSFADRWAQGLVKQFASAPPAQPKELKEWLAPLQKEWSAGIDWENLPWFAEEKAKTGAFSTFLGLTFAEEEPPRKNGLLGRTWFFRKQEKPVLKWHAMSVGDTCLFQIRNAQLIHSFPMDNSEQFNSRPVLLSSNAEHNTGVWEGIRTDEGECQPDDLFVLATDAVAKWFLERHQSGEKPWEILNTLQTPREFEDLIGKLREEKSIRNDDATIVLFTWKKPDKET
ncbi:MAG: hypothetical protein SFY81_09680 [Verrucomicrobiota bacterium]|nr:hypothetical protein [Verrucomicrobiota bacterium]